jgi:hypothetical protein
VEGGLHDHKSDAAFTTVRPQPAPASQSGVRLAFSRAFNILAAILIIVLSFILWRNLPRRGRFALPRQRLLHFFFFLPRTIVAALFVAAVTAVILDLITRFVITPLVTIWYRPRVPNPLESGTLSFQLGPAEQIQRMTPCRWRHGRSWVPGSLVETNQRIWFAPARGDAWSIPVTEVLAWNRVPPPTWAFGLIRGIPDHLELLSVGRAPQRIALDPPDRFVPCNMLPDAHPTVPPHA